MDPGADAARHDFRARTCRTDWRKRRPLLGRPLVPQLRHPRPDYTKANCGTDCGDLWLRKMFSAVFYSRQRNPGTKTILGVNIDSGHNVDRLGRLRTVTHYSFCSPTGTFWTTSMANPSSAGSRRGWRLNSRLLRRSK